MANPFAVPAPWRTLVAFVNEGSGSRIPDGTPGIRDVDAPCEAFEPAGEPWVRAAGNGDCDTDGHYICRECVHISRNAVEERDAR